MLSDYWFIHRLSKTADVWWVTPELLIESPATPSPHHRRDNQMGHLLYTIPTNLWQPIPCLLVYIKGAWNRWESYLIFIHQYTRFAEYTYTTIHIFFIHSGMYQIKFKKIQMANLQPFIDQHWAITQQCDFWEGSHDLNNVNLSISHKPL